MATTPVIISSVPKSRFWHRGSTGEVLATLGSTANGLSAEEAAQRLAANGPNELKEGKRIKPWEVFLAQFKSLLIWILMSAALISGFLGEWIDCFAILAIVVLNAFIGFYQEFKAEQSIVALKKLTAPRAKVRRNAQ
jgi:Ca2+-transporting ATPase